MAMPTTRLDEKQVKHRNGRNGSGAVAGAVDDPAKPASSTTSSKDEPAKPSSSSASSKSLGGRDMFLCVVLAVAYGSFMFCRMFFSVTADAIRKDLHFRTTDVTTLIVVSAVAYGVGKGASGVLLDRMDAKHGLYLSMLVTSALVLLFSSCTSYTQMLAISLLNSFPQAAGYPAVAKLAYEYFDPQLYGKAFSVISVGSRVGSLSSSLLLGAAIGSVGWRGAVRMAPAITLSALVCAACLITWMGPTRHGKVAEGAKAGESTKTAEGDAKTPETQEPISSKFRRVLGNSQWWVVNLGSSFLLVSKGFEAYAALYVGDVLRASASTSGMLIAAIPGGIVGSLLVGGSFLEALPLRRKARWTVVLCVLNLVSLLVLTGLTWAFEVGRLDQPSEPTDEVGKAWFVAAQMVQKALGMDGDSAAPPLCMSLVGCLLFAVGFGAGYPFYIPQSIFALELGGKDSAMVIGCGELMQALVAATFALSGGRLAETMGWRYVLGMLSVGALGSVLCMCLFFHRRIKNDATQGKGKDN